MSALNTAILDAYHALKRRPGGPVSLADLRARLDGWQHSVVTDALLGMDWDREIHLQPNPYRAGLTDEDRAAAVLLAGKVMHDVRVSEHEDLTEESAR